MHPLFERLGQALRQMESPLSPERSLDLCWRSVLAMIAFARDEISSCIHNVRISMAVPYFFPLVNE